MMMETVLTSNCISDTYPFQMYGKYSDVLQQNRNVKYNRGTELVVHIWSGRTIKLVSILSILFALLSFVYERLECGTNVSCIVIFAENVVCWPVKMNSDDFFRCKLLFDNFMSLFYVNLSELIYERTILMSKMVTRKKKCFPQDW